MGMIVDVAGISAAVSAIVLSILAFLQYRSRRKDGLASKTEEITKQKSRALYWYMENFHRVRRLCIDNGLGELLKGIPFEPPDVIIKGERKDGE